MCATTTTLELDSIWVTTTTTTQLDVESIWAVDFRWATTSSLNNINKYGQPLSQLDVDLRWEISSPLNYHFIWAASIMVTVVEFCMPCEDKMNV
ncbi:unnamed protein product [Heligmosomoides polygyrus]|uniref:Neur_chan_LBD domain-containing protein n=1 Tax=Heligmosomoides polygyrus TaxID=6339 RepID=A0A183F890_HELPZ|nr:unnamed protein product [Heligmosomoides polygyrus]